MTVQTARLLAQKRAPQKEIPNQLQSALLKAAGAHKTTIKNTAAAAVGSAASAVASAVASVEAVAEAAVVAVAAVVVVAMAAVGGRREVGGWRW